MPEYVFQDGPGPRAVFSSRFDLTTTSDLLRVFEIDCTESFPNRQRRGDP
jgi:hypothetical protein